MRDKEIRVILKQYLASIYTMDLIIDELDVVNGNARIDVVSIGDDYLRGFEIKSDHDSLVRLPNQIKQYNKIFDYVTLVVGEKYINKAASIIPDWWGILQINKDTLNIVRECKQNENIDNLMLANLLWKAEATQFLRSRKMKVQKYKGNICINISKNYTHEEIRKHVCASFKSRINWR